MTYVSHPHQPITDHTAHEAFRRRQWWPSRVRLGHKRPAMRIHHVALLLCFTSSLAHAQAQGPVSWIDHRADLGAPSTRLSADEVSAITRVGRTLGTRQGYYFNGCQARAHAAWMMLPPATRDRVGKVWVFAPHLMQVISPLRAERLKTPLDGRVAWDFHVALTYLSYTGEEQVVDLAIGDQPMPMQTWLKSFTIPKGSWAIRSSGSWYSFNKSPEGVVNDFWKYTGGACEQGWLPKTVAFEAVGKLLAQGSDGCPAFSTTYMHNAVGGYQTLEFSDFSTSFPGDSCGRLRETYLAEKARLTSLLPRWTDPARGPQCGVPDDGGRP